MGYLCDTHPTTPGALLITNLDNGDTAVLCHQCVHPWSAAIAAATAPDTLDEPISLEPSDPITGDPTHDDGAGDADPVPPEVPPAPSPEPVPDVPDDDELADVGNTSPEALAYRIARRGLLEPADADA